MKKIIMALIFIAVIIFAIQDNSNSSNLKNEYLDEIVTLIENKEYDKVLTMKAPDVLDDSYKREEKILKIYAKALLQNKSTEYDSYQKMIDILSDIPDSYNGRLANNILALKDNYIFNPNKARKNIVNSSEKKQTSTSSPKKVKNNSIYSRPLANYGDYENHRISNNLYIEFSMSGKPYVFTTMGGFDKKAYILDDELIRMMGQGMIDDYDLERLAMIGAIYKFDNFYHCIFITEEIPRLLICNPVERTFKFFNGLKKNGTYESVESHRFIKLSLR